MAKYIIRGRKHYGTVDDVVDRIEALEAALLAADELARAVEDRGGLSSERQATALAAYRSAADGK